MMIAIYLELVSNLLSLWPTCLAAVTSVQPPYDHSRTETDEVEVPLEDGLPPEKKSTNIKNCMQ